jgi:hypothetical protein
VTLGALPIWRATSTTEVGWLRDWHGNNSERVLRYWEARFDEVAGQYVVRELVCPADQVADILERGIGGTTREIERYDGADTVP